MVHPREKVPGVRKGCPNRHKDLRELVDGVQSGRPSKFTPALGAEICRRLAEGETLIEICETEGFPALATVGRWTTTELRPTPELDAFRAAYARAMEARAFVIASRVEATAKEPPRMVTKGDSEVVDHGHVAYLRHQAQTLQWLASKLGPRQFGDRQAVEHSGAVSLAKLVEESMREEKKS